MPRGGNSSEFNCGSSQTLNGPHFLRKELSVIPGSSVAEQMVVSRQVAGSNPVPGSHFSLFDRDRRRA